jgi:hypothetical protein
MLRDQGSLQIASLQIWKCVSPASDTCFSFQHTLAPAQAGAASKGVPLYRHIADLAGNQRPVLPVPSFNVINGGVHAGNVLAPQEFMILPVGCAGGQRHHKRNCLRGCEQRAWSFCGAAAAFPC